MFKFLLWLHFIGIGMAVGGGIGLSRVGPQLVKSAESESKLLWPLEIFFGRIGAAGFLILLVTGPAMLWIHFNGVTGMPWLFWVKMIFVTVAFIAIGIHEWAGVKFRKGDQSVIPLMFTGGRIAGASIVLAMAFAVMTFS